MHRPYFTHAHTHTRYIPLNKHSSMGHIKDAIIPDCFLALKVMDFAHVRAQSSYRLLPNGIAHLASQTCTWVSRVRTHKHTQKQAIPPLPNGVGPLRMTTRPLRISGHYPQGSASRPRGPVQPPTLHAVLNIPHPSKQVCAPPRIPPLPS